MCFRLVIPHKICTKEDFLLQVFPQQHSISLDIVFLFSLQAGEGISMVKDESLPWLTEKSKKNEKKGKTRTRLSAKRLGYSERQTWWFLMKKRKSMKKWVKVRMDKKVNASLIQKDTNIMICGPMPNHIVPLSTFTRKLVRIFGSLAQLWIINGIGGNFVFFAWINLTHGNRSWIYGSLFNFLDSVVGFDKVWFLSLYDGDHDDDVDDNVVGRCIRVPRKYCPPEIELSVPRPHLHPPS